MNPTNPAYPIPTETRWEVHYGDCIMYGETMEEVLSRARKQIEKREKEGLWWELKQSWRVHRTKPFPKVLIVGSEHKAGTYFERPADKWVKKFSQDYLEPKARLIWTDSSGTRSVFWYTESKKHDPDYEKDAMDLPAEVFLKIGGYLDVNNVPVHLLLRREDPGQGIFLEEDTPENAFSYREDKELDPRTKEELDYLQDIEDAENEDK